MLKTKREYNHAKLKGMVRYKVVMRQQKRKERDGIQNQGILKGKKEKKV